MTTTRTVRPCPTYHVDTALSTEGRFPSLPGDYLVQFVRRDPTAPVELVCLVVVSARYTEAADAGQAAELARDLLGELGLLPGLKVAGLCRRVG